MKKFEKDYMKYNHIIMSFSSYCTAIMLFSVQLFILTSSLGQSQLIFLPQEKVYIHTDRSSYSGGETIFYSAYLRSGMVDSMRSKVLYIDLMGPGDDIISSQMIEINDGTGAGSIDIPVRINSGAATLRAYTQYMLNGDEAFLYRKPVMIYGVSAPPLDTNTEVRPILNIFPEGGYLLRDVPSVVGIKVDRLTDSRTVDIYRNGDHLKTAELSDYGFGKSTLSVNSGDVYEFYYGSERFTLSDVQDEGAMLRTITDADHISIVIQRTADYDIGEHQLIVLSEGALIYNTHATEKKIILPKNTLPPGVITIALIDGEQRPISERLVFNHIGTDNQDIKLSLDQDRYQTRSRVTGQLKLRDREEDPIQGTCSVSITDYRYYSDYQDIRAYMWLQSEIKGYIHDVHQYLSIDTQDLVGRTDLLMLTQGWRRYLHSDDIADIKPAEVSQRIVGRVVKKNNNSKGVKAYGTLTITTGMFAHLPFETDEMGYFLIDGISIKDTSTLLFKVGKKRKSSGEIKYSEDLNIEIDSIYTLPSSVYDEVQIEGSTMTTAPSLDLFDIVAADDFYVDEGMLLDEVTVGAKKIDKWIDYHKNVMRYKEPPKRFFTDKIPVSETYDSVLDFIRGRFPGITINKTGIIVRGQEAVLLIDGFRAIWENFIEVPPMNIAFLDVLSSISQTSVYGTNSPIVALYRKPPGERTRQKPRFMNEHIIKTYYGYAQSKIFFNPVYSSDHFIPKDIDRRTVGWFTDLASDEEGIIGLSFYTSDYIGSYYICAECIDINGGPISVKGIISVY